MIPFFKNKLFSALGGIGDGGKQSSVDQNFSKKKKLMKLALIGGLIVLLDQLTKAVILQSLPLHDSITVIPGFFDITHIHNPGGAFGFFANQSPMLRKILFLFISSLAVIFVFYFYIRTPASHPMLASGFALIFGGAVGNMIDRIRFGKVIDFLDVYIGVWHWPVFNVADSAISIGVAVFIFHILFDKLPE
ncbi:MAG: signal peptidase II [Desulfobacteraceae bacterium IS3]|nr:MAG: signal peptidase II [Desulfobacteraceae bacterium IS3]